MSERQVLNRTVYLDQENDIFCSCSGDFWKTCSLRVANNLDCQESLVSITPIERNQKDPAADESVRLLDKSLSDLKKSLKVIEKRFKI
jgi:hypothetical protein